MYFETIDIKNLNIQVDSKKPISYLFDSVKNFNILQPILVIQSDGGNYQVVAGERRAKAALEAGIDRIPAIVIDEKVNESLLLLIENLIRQKNIAKEAEAVKKLVEQGYDTDTIVKITGISKREISKLYQLSTKLIPELMEKLKAGEIAPSTAFKAIQLTVEQQRSLLNEKKITLKLVEDKLREKKLSEARITIRNLSLMFQDIDREIEIRNIKEKIKKFSIKKEEIFEEE